jgi:hypothetical protein
MHQFSHSGTLGLSHHVARSLDIHALKGRVRGSFLDDRNEMHDCLAAVRGAGEREWIRNVASDRRDTFGPGARVAIGVS